MTNQAHILYGYSRDYYLLICVEKSRFGLLFLNFGVLGPNLSPKCLWLHTQPKLALGMELVGYTYFQITFPKNVTFSSPTPLKQTYNAYLSQALNVGD